jgi:hypothetical protein
MNFFQSGLLIQPQNIAWQMLCHPELAKDLHCRCGNIKGPTQ